MPFTVTGGKYALQTLTAVGTNTITVNAAVPFVVADFNNNQRIAALYTPAGSTVVTNGDFATNSDWTLGAGATISGGAANFTSSAAMLSQNIAFTVGQRYIVTVQYTRTAGASLVFCNSLVNGTNNITTVATVNTATLTTITFAFTAVGNGFLIAAAGAVFTGTIDNVVINVSAQLKGIAYARRATSTTVLELETPFFDHATGITATQVIGDRILISKNWAECATAGWTVSNSVSSITDRATIGVIGDEAGACIYDESRLMQSALTSGTLPPIILLGGVWMQGHLQDYATGAIYGGCDFFHNNTSISEVGVQPRDLAAHYIVYGGTRAVPTGQTVWEPAHLGNTICQAKTLIWRGVDAQGGVLSPNDGTAWFPGTEARMQFIDVTATVASGFNVAMRPGNAVVRGGGAKITASNALAVFGTGYNGFTIGAPSGERYIVSDVRSGGFWDQFFGTPATANFTNVLTPVTTVARPSGSVTFNFNFQSAYQNLGIGSLIQILKADGTTTETSITTTTVNTDLTVLARTISGTGGNPPTIYNNANWTYAIWRYGSLPLSGAFAQSSYSLGTAGNALDVVHGGFFNQLADLSITEPNAATVAAYTTLETLDKIYDYSMHWKAASNSNMKAFGISNQICIANGPILDFGNLNLHLDQNAATAFAANTTTNTVTIKAGVVAAGVKFTSLKTTGAVTFANGSFMSATYTSAAGTSAQLNLLIIPIGSRILVLDNNDQVVEYVSSSQASYVCNIAPGATGTWKWVVKSPGYEHARGTFFPAIDARTSVSPTLIKKVNADGSDMYQGTTSNLVAVSFSASTTAFIDIGNGLAPLQAVFDESEDALCTLAGMSWLGANRDDLSQFNSAAGDFLFLTSGWRLRRATAGDANATVNAFVQSVDGNPVDETNGPVRFFTSDNPTAVAVAVRAELAVELARIDATISSRLATAGYTAPPTAATNASAVRAEIAPELAKVGELHAIHGLDAASPMTVTPTSRVAGDIEQTITGDGTTTSTVTRAA